MECIENVMPDLLGVPCTSKEPVERSSEKKDPLGTKMSDSACGSLYGSEESGSKCHEIDSNHGDLDLGSDSFDCDNDVSQFSDSEGDVTDDDNNTFNVINTENSESQEISESTTEGDSSNCCDKNIENEASADLGTETEVNEEKILELVNVNQNEHAESSSSSIDTNESPIPNNCKDVDEGNENEKASSSNSNDGDKCPTQLMESESESLILNVSNHDKTGSLDSKFYEENNPLSESNKTDGTKNKNSIPDVKLKSNTSSTTSESSGRLSNNNKKKEITIEIFESKRKPIATLSKDDHITTNSSNQCENLVPCVEKRSNIEESQIEGPEKINEHINNDPSNPESGQPINPIENESPDVKRPLEDGMKNTIIAAEEDPQENSSKKCRKSHQSDKGSAKPPSKENSVSNPSSVLNESDSKKPTEESGEAEESCNEEVKKQSPLAFTVDFGSAPSDSPSSVKKLDISASISQWIPKHRRNLSLTKVEENKKVEEKRGSEKPPPGRPRSGTVGASGSVLIKRGTAGYHSEGYFSSDQDDDGSKRTADLKSSPRSPRTPDVSTAPKPKESTKDISPRMRPPSPFSPGSSYSAPLTETASLLIEKFLSATPETKRKHSSKSEVRTCCKERERKPSVSELTRKPNKIEKKMSLEEKLEASNFIIDDSDVLDEEKDDVSDTGTYTIDKDSPSAEEDRARNKIDEVFQVGADIELEDDSASNVQPRSTAVVCHNDESNWISSTSKIVPTISRSSPNWIHEWAAHVAEQTKPPVDPLPRNSKPSHTSVGNGDARPRRKLPTPPSHLDPPSSPRNNQRDAMYRARLDRRNASFESHESGADSDFDTSASYPINEDERLPASLRNRLRLSSLSPKSKGAMTSSLDSMSPRRMEGANMKETKYKSRDVHVNGEVYESYDGGREENGLPSDSSSEESEQYKDTTRIPDNNPPLKFNRAFSLRRARLGFDDSVSSHSVEKKKSNRPSSAGSALNGRKTTSAVARSPRNAESANSQLKKDRSGAKKPATRSSSTLSSKEVDFQNWKRRKNYDPMKAAAEGRKKQGQSKTTLADNQESQTSSGFALRSSSPSSLHRSASFHGTDSGISNMRWPRKLSRTSNYPSEDDGPYSLEEEIGPPPSPCRGSPLHRSLTSPRQLSLSPAKQLQNTKMRRTSIGHCEDDQSHFRSQTRKISLGDSGSEGQKSPLNRVNRVGGTPAAPSPGTGRPKTKMEALDNLVISTIHSLSVKVRTTSESLVQKLKSQYDEEGDRAALLDEVLSHLSESDHSLAAGQTRSTSRELAGILRNLKNIEHALEVIDRVIVVGDEDYRDDEDQDYIPTEWIESDY